MENAFRLPEVWTNDDEMYRLMQRIKRPREIDSINYDRKVDFWRELILNYAKHNRILVITECSLKKLFARQFISDGATLFPECLHQVLNDMIVRGVIDIGNQVGPIGGALNWVFEWLVKKPASWTFSFITENNSPSKVLDQRLYESPDAPLVITGLLPPLSEYFVKHLDDSSNSLIPDAFIYTEEDFDTSLTQVFTHDTTRNYMRNYLLNKGIFRIERSTSFKLVYRAEEMKTLAIDPKVLSSIAHLRKTLRQLSADESRLSNDILTRQSQIKKLLREKRKSEALSLLRRSKQLEAERERKSNHIAQLEALELKITAAKDNRTVLQAITETSSALRHTTKGAKGVTEAEDTMDEMAELIHHTNEISNALSFTQGLDIVDDDELEAELISILGDKKSEPTKSPLAVPPENEVAEDELMRQLDALNVTEFPPFHTAQATTGT